MSTLSDITTHSRAGNATMVDTDGLLKWGPHNLLTYSEDFTNAAWSKTNTTVTPNAVAAPDGTMTADLLAVSTSGDWRILQTNPTDDTGYTFRVWLRTVSGEGTAGIRIFNGATFEDTLCDVNESWTLFEVSHLGTNQNCYIDSRVSGANLTQLYAWGAHLYRSDLGGMVDNPDRGDSYVPTTDSAAYLPRTDNHIWDGSQWVKGYLHESEARTNIIFHSEDFEAASWLNTVLGTSTRVNSGTKYGSVLGEITATSANGGLRLSTGSVLTDGAKHSFSCYIEGGDYEAKFTTENSVATYGTVCGVNINPSTGAISGELGFLDVITTPYGDGYSVELRFPNESGNDTFNFEIRLPNAAVLFIGRPQFEAGATSSSYIPTAGSTVTRAADVMTIPIENIPYPEPVVIGPELVTNGTFDTDLTGWTDDSTGAGSTSQSGGQAVLTGAGTSDQGILFQTFTTVTGNVYRLTLDRPTSSVIVQLGAAGSGSSNIHQSSNSSGPIDHVFVALSTSTTVTVRNFNVVGDSAVDNISVREINPLAVSIAVEGYMTYADSDNSNEVVFHQWQLDASNRISARVATNSTKIGDPFFEQAALGVSDFVTGADDTYSPGINVPFSIASRNGSTFINGAVDGTALTANTTPVAFPDLSATDMSLFTTGNFHITKFRMWGDTNGDIGDTGIAEASA